MKYEVRNMSQTKRNMNIRNVLEIHRITCAEMDCRPTEITGPVALAAADQVAESDPELGAWLRERAEEMDRPVALSDIRASLESLLMSSRTRVAQ